MRRPLARRNSSSSMWEQGSTQYWKKHDKMSRTSYGIAAGMFVAIGVVSYGIYLYAFAPPPLVPKIDAVPLPPSPLHVEPDGKSFPPENVRQKCRQEAIQTVWHQNSCENICAKARGALPKPLVHTACIDGCTYSTIMTSEGACFKGSGVKGEKCPFSPNCVGGCAAFADQVPRPTLRKQCEEACAAIAEASCSRALDYLHKYYTAHLNENKAKSGV